MLRVPSLQALRLSLAVVIAGVLQTAVLGRLNPYPYSPDLVLATALVGAWQCGPLTGCWLGLLAGGLTAAPSGGFYAGFMVSRAAACAALGWARGEVYGDPILVQIAFTGLATLLAEGMMFLWRAPHLSASWRAFAVEAGGNALLAPLIGLLLKRRSRTHHFGE